MMKRHETVEFPFKVTQDMMPPSQPAKPSEGSGRYAFFPEQGTKERVTIPPPACLPSGTQFTPPDTEPAPKALPSVTDDWVISFSNRVMALREEIMHKANEIADQVEGQLGRRSGAQRDRTPSEALADIIDILRAETEENVKLIDHLDAAQFDLAEHETRETV